jgi:hypothetical protein
VDFGPFTTDQVLEMITAREIDLGTHVCNVAERKWEPLGSHAEFRTHYADAEKSWTAEAAAQHERQLRTRRKLTGGAWWTVLTGALTFIVFAGWMTWRLSRAEPTGILQAVTIGQPPELPAITPQQEPRPLVIPPGTRVRRLRETAHYDTRGVGVEGQGGELVNTMSFDGDSAELSDAALNKVVAAARRKLTACAQSAATRSASFTGTRVSFVVRSGGLGAFTVGSEVSGHRPFKACVKQALQAVSVPTFGGSQRKVTVPLSVRR